MAEFRLAIEAESELDDIWLYLARESGSLDIADVVITEFPREQLRDSLSGCGE